MKTTDKTGKVVGALVVLETDDVMLMTNTGQSVRIPVNQIREAGRNTQGVKLISLREGELLQDIARVLAEADEEAAADGTPSSGPVEGEAPPEETA
jgi:DNA gyrase subunit A